MQALDIDGDNDNDLILALEGTPPTIWVNPGLNTSGIAPTGSPTANTGTTFPLDTTLPPDGATDVALADIDGDGRTDILLAYGTGFEVVLAPALPSSTIVADWEAAGAAAKKVPVASAKYIKVADMDNDGFLDIVVAGGKTSFPADASKIFIYFGDALTKSSGDYSAAQWVKVGYLDVDLTYVAIGPILALDVADVDGDGFMDVAVSYANTSKRVYFGKKAYTEGAPACAGAPVGNRDGWLSAPAVVFGPSSQAARSSGPADRSPPSLRDRVAAPW